MCTCDATATSANSTAVAAVRLPHIAGSAAIVHYALVVRLDIGVNAAMPWECRCVGRVSVASRSHDLYPYQAWSDAADLVLSWGKEKKRCDS